MTPSKETRADLSQMNDAFKRAPNIFLQQHEKFIEEMGFKSPQLKPKSVRNFQPNRTAVAGFMSPLQANPDHLAKKQTAIGQQRVAFIHANEEQQPEAAEEEPIVLDHFHHGNSKNKNHLLMRKTTISKWDPRHKKRNLKVLHMSSVIKGKDGKEVDREEVSAKVGTFKTAWMQNDQKLMHYHRFFDQNFKHVRDLDIHQLESQLGYPREEIISNFIVYVSLCKLLASQNMQASLRQQQIFLQQMKQGGLTFDQLRNVFPLLRYENRFIIDKIFNSAIEAEIIEDALSMPQFLKCAGILKCGSFEEKVKVIDFESKGYLTWKDMKNLCKQYSK